VERRGGAGHCGNQTEQKRLEDEASHGTSRIRTSAGAIIAPISLSSSNECDIDQMHT
jgi:hypothetical protein